MGILYGLLAAFFWGLADFLIAHLTRRVGTGRALLYAQVLSLLAWVILLFTYADQTNADAGSTPLLSTIWLVTIVTGVFHVAGLALAYRAFEIGTVSLVSPIISGFAIVTALLALATGEHPPALALAGALCLIAGVTLATRTPSDPQASSAEKKATLAGVPEALGSAVAFGTMFWLFYFFVQPQLGYVWPLIVLKVMASGSSLLSVLAVRSKLEAVAESPPSETTPPPDGASSLRTVGLLALGTALADTLAWMVYIWGTATEYATVVTALASLFSVITILLAWLLLRERLARHQWVGVAIILMGIGLVSV
ncbi:MAG TPA: EamA family transporter [Abditibacteriaceae bacterium]|nr:EamA family transporter [Abditibacteriaceae bacterium]